MVNTLYSFYWDVVHDWDLGHASAAHPMLRDQLVFRSPAIYYGVMTINFMLRFSWSIKLSSHVRLHDELRYWLLRRRADRFGYRALTARRCSRSAGATPRQHVHL